MTRTPLTLPHSDFQRGFTLVELAMVLIIIALLVGGLLLSLSASRDIANERETQKQLSEIKEALLGFAVANGRLPCPASAASNGVESFCTNETGPCGAIIVPPALPRPDHGRCSNPYNGLLPSVTLGIPGVDTNGYLVDGWGTTANIANRFRYAVFSTLDTGLGAINSVNHPLTATNGMRTATMAGISGRTPLLSVCTMSTGVINAGNATAQCTPATMLTNSAAAIVFSLGRNAPTGGTGSDEAANLDNDPAFVSHTQEDAAAGGEFDDLVTWLSPNILFNRMIAAGRLP